jgi:hypothetical protein
MLPKLVLVIMCLTISACTGMTVERYSNEAGMPGFVFKTVEVYKQNAVGPSFNYIMLFTCDPQNEMACTEVQRTPTVTPGVVASIVAPVIQAGAIIGGSVIVGNGLSNIKVNPQINPKITFPTFP